MIAGGISIAPSLNPSMPIHTMARCVQHLSRIRAPSLEELSLVDCGLDDEDLDEIGRTMIVNCRNLIEVDLSRNEIKHFSDEVMACLPRATLRVLILDGNPMVTSTSSSKTGGSTMTTAPSFLGRARELAQFFPNLGYLGQDWDGADGAGHSAVITLEVQRILRENRMRSRRAMFQSRVLDRPRIAVSLWPLMLERALRCFFVSTWDVNKRYSATCSIAEAHDMMERDAIYALLRDRGVGEMFQ
jgi:Leucine rich repeat